MTHTQDLLPCPFCGGTAYIGRGKRGHSCYCRTCKVGWSLTVRMSREQAIAAWNRRVPAPAVPDDVAGLVDRLKKVALWAADQDQGGVMSLIDTAADALEAQAAELARLRADMDQGAKDYCDLMDQRDVFHVRVKALEDALRPFVVYVHDDLRKGKTTYELVAVDRHGGGLIGAEDLRRARAALQPTGDA